MRGPFFLSSCFFFTVFFRRYDLTVFNNVTSSRPSKMNVQEAINIETCISDLNKEK